MRTFALLVLALLSIEVSSAATFKSEAEIRAHADRVMTKVAAGNLTGAFADMKPYVIVPPDEFDAMALNSKSQRGQFGARYGTPVGYEFIAQKKMGDSLLRLIYVEKTERHALPWTFVFYRGPKGWVLNSFSWHDRLPDLFGAP